MIRFFKYLSVFLLASILFIVGGLSIFILVEETRHSKGLLPLGLEISGLGRVSADFVPFDSDCGAAIFNIDEKSVKEMDLKDMNYLNTLTNTKNNRYTYKTFERIQSKNFIDGIYGLDCARFFLSPTERDIHKEVMSERGFIGYINGFPAYLLILPRLKIAALVFYTT